MGDESRSLSTTSMILLKMNRFTKANEGNEGRAKVWLRCLCLLLLSLFLSATGRTLHAEVIPSERRITWQGNVGIPGGIPERETISVTLTNPTTSQLQSAIDGAASNSVVLWSGTNIPTGILVLKSFVTLRTNGPAFFDLTGVSNINTVIRFGSEEEGENIGTAHSITLGSALRGATNITLNNVTSISVGDLLVIDELNNTNFVSNVGNYGTISWNSRNSGARARGQTVEVLSITGTNVTFTPPLYSDFTLTPEAVSFGFGCQWAGWEGGTIIGAAAYRTNGFEKFFYMAGSKYCWVKGVETGYADGDHGQIYWSFRCEVRDSYFHDGLKHTSGSTDCSLTIAAKSSGILVENNIFERMHTAIILNWGTSGSVIGYNYALNPYDSGSTNVLMYDYCGNHGAHPEFNLFEGNIGGQFRDDTAWGTSGRNTFHNNWATGESVIYAPYDARGAVQSNTIHYATQGLRAMVADFGQSSNNYTGNILGNSNTVAIDQYITKVTSPLTVNRFYTGTNYLFSFGYGDVSDGGDYSLDSTNAFETAFFDGNYNPVTGAVEWRSGDQTKPASYYLPSKPAWMGNLTHPWHDSTNGYTNLSVTLQSAGFRRTYGTNPPAGDAVVAGLKRRFKRTLP